MNCKLCLEHNNLIRKSHIIPDFMYVDLFDGKHRLHEGRFTENGTLKAKIKQSGAYENQILCETCDNKILGGLEHYAKGVLYGGERKMLQKRVNPRGIEYTYCAELDYAKFKLFLLSLVWRASISKLPVFKEVSLGPHEEIMRRMIYTSDPGEPADYPCLMLTYRHLEILPHQIVGQPRLARDGGGYTYYFSIGGTCYIFFISKHDIPAFVQECVINRSGELKIVHLKDYMAKGLINRILGVDFFESF